MVKNLGSKYREQNSTLFYVSKRRYVTFLLSGRRLNINKQQVIKFIERFGGGQNLIEGVKFDAPSK